MVVGNIHGWRWSVVAAGNVQRRRCSVVAQWRSLVVADGGQR